MITLQQMFTRVRLHLLKQNEKAEAAYTLVDGGCKYRIKNREGKPLLCGFGPLIPDSFYKKSMENKIASVVLERNPKLAKRLGVVDGQLDAQRKRRLITDLQITHDDFEVSEWRKRLSVVGRRYKLKIFATDKGRL